MKRRQRSLLQNLVSGKNTHNRSRRLRSRFELLYVNSYFSLSIMKSFFISYESTSKLDSWNKIYILSSSFVISLTRVFSFSLTMLKMTQVSILLDFSFDRPIARMLIDCQCWTYLVLHIDDY